MKLRTTSAALVVLALGTSAWADEGAFSPSNFVDCGEATFVAGVLETDLSEQTASVETGLPAEADRIAAIVDRIAQDTIIVGSLPPPFGSELSATASSFATDAAEVTGSLQIIELAPEGFEDR
jgi:hypothetical protein